MSDSPAAYLYGYHGIVFRDAFHDEGEMASASGAEHFPGERLAAPSVDVLLHTGLHHGGEHGYLRIE